MAPKETGGRFNARLNARRRRAYELTRHERTLWRDGLVRVAGIDEAGRGPLAGPVVAAAVVLPPGRAMLGVDDSKRLTSAERERAYRRIRACALDVGVGVVDQSRIDEINIYHATVEAMTLAVASLSDPPDHLLIDAMRLRAVSLSQTPIVGGDALSMSIAAASIIAKVTRDRLMVELDAQYPQWGFAAHKGYYTQQHRRALEEFGPSPIHRRSFLTWFRGGAAGATGQTRLPLTADGQGETG